MGINDLCVLDWIGIEAKPKDEPNLFFRTEPNMKLLHLNGRQQQQRKKTRSIDRFDTLEGQIENLQLAIIIVLFSILTRKSSFSVFLRRNGNSIKLHRYLEESTDPISFRSVITSTNYSYLFTLNFAFALVIIGYFENYVFLEFLLKSE